MMRRVHVPVIFLCVIITAESDLCDVLAVIHDLNDWKDLGLYN